MLVLHVLHVQQNGQYDFVINLHLKSGYYNKRITTFAFHFHDEMTLYSKHKSYRWKQKAVYISECPYFFFHIVRCPV